MLIAQRAAAIPDLYRRSLSARWAIVRFKTGTASLHLPREARLTAWRADADESVDPAGGAGLSVVWARAEMAIAMHAKLEINMLRR